MKAGARILHIPQVVFQMFSSVFFFLTLNVLGGGGGEEEEEEGGRKKGSRVGRKSGKAAKGIIHVCFPD